jgi:hypothetical protein
MTSNDCKLVRREIDEADLNQQLSSAASQHLHSCPACRSFRDERRGLRSLMSSLETVAAPADFDFRLRARLAREKDRPNGVFAIGDLIGARSLATVALILLIAVAGIIVRNRMSSTNGRAAVQANTPIPEVRTAQEETKGITPPPVLSERDSETVASKANQNAGSLGAIQRHLARTPATGGQRTSSVVAQNKQGVRESGVTPSIVVTPIRPADVEPVVRVPIDARSLRLSVDNGHGSARTISLPSFSFGSQRVLASGFSFAPTVFEKEHKGVW